MSLRESHVHGDDDSCRLVDYYQGRCFSMPHYTNTTYTTLNTDITAVISPRQSADMDRLHAAYLGGKVEGARLMDIPDWNNQQVVRRSRRNNKESSSEEDREDSRRGFSLDQVSGHVSLRGHSRSSRRHRHTDKVSGITKRVRNVTLSDVDISRDHKRTVKKKKKKKKKGGWLSSSWFGCKSTSSVQVV